MPPATNPPENRTAPPLPERLPAMLVALAAGAGILYILVRFTQTVWFATPYYGFTTGSEEEALYSIWKWLRGLPVYGDMFDIPYAASYFNWLFYAVYGTVNREFLAAFGLNEAMIPAISRCLTLALHAGSVGVLVAIARRLGLRRCGWSYALFALLNLCYGLWAITTRPDVGALLLELVGFWTILKFEEKRQRRWLFALVASLYCAWAFKQTSVNMITVYCLALLFQRRFRDLFWVALPTFALYGATFALGGPLYGYACILSQSRMGFFPSLGARNFILASLKAPLLGAAVVLIPGLLPLARHTRPLGNRLVPGVFLFSLFLALLTATKNGAYANYFFMPAAFGALCLADLADQVQVPRLAALARCAVAAAALFQIGLIPRQLLQPEGTHILQRQHRDALLVKAGLESLPAPILVHRPDLSLPWIQTRPPHFVFAFTYFGDREFREFRHGGMGGLARDGFFGTIVLAKDTPPVFDGHSLDLYTLARSDAAFDYYVRKD